MRTLQNKVESLWGVGVGPAGDAVQLGLERACATQQPNLELGNRQLVPACTKNKQPFAIAHNSRDGQVYGLGFPG